jgi:hypothetical protein
LFDLPPISSHYPAALSPHTPQDCLGRHQLPVLLSTLIFFPFYTHLRKHLEVIFHFGNKISIETNHRLHRCTSSESPTGLPSPLSLSPRSLRAWRLSPVAAWQVLPLVCHYASESSIAVPPLCRSLYAAFVCHHVPVPSRLST